MRSWQELSVWNVLKIISATSCDILVHNMKATGEWTDGFIFRSLTRAEKTKLADKRKLSCCAVNKTSSPLHHCLDGKYFIFLADHNLLKEFFHRKKAGWLVHPKMK